jgi:AcrR family transcriptional regulator
VSASSAPRASAWRKAATRSRRSRRFAGRAGVSAGALYRHFPSEAELFVRLFRDTADREVDAMGEAARSL